MFFNSNLFKGFSRVAVISLSLGLMISLNLHSHSALAAAVGDKNVLEADRRLDKLVDLIQVQFRHTRIEANKREINSDDMGSLVDAINVVYREISRNVTTLATFERIVFINDEMNVCDGQRGRVLEVGMYSPHLVSVLSKVTDIVDAVGRNPEKRDRCIKILPAWTGSLSVFTDSSIVDRLWDLSTKNVIFSDRFSYNVQKPNEVTLGGVPSGGSIDEWTKSTSTFLDSVDQLRGARK